MKNLRQILKMHKGLALALIFLPVIFLSWFIFSYSENIVPYKNSNISFEERARDLVSRMTLEEKVSQMVHNSKSIDRLGVPEYNWWNECLHGVGRAGLATVFPQAIGMAAMWDTDEMFEIANVISDEARAKHHDFVRQGKRGIYQGLTYWTPNINIFRDPRWGRGMETYGEDPFLTGELAVEFIKGLQGKDEKYLKLVATAKHFVVHSGPESERHRFNAVPCKRDFVETYTPHFKKAIKQGGVYSIMCAYNRLYNEPCCGSKDLEKLLRNDWGFSGYIVSDCGAIDDFFQPNTHKVTETDTEASVLAVNAGTDLNCGNTYNTLVKAVRSGLIDEKKIDRSVVRLMVARMKLGMFDDPSMVPYTKIPISVVNCENHKQMALKAAQKSIVLLKNRNNILPLSRNIKNVAVIGPNANNIDVLLGNYNGFPANPVTPFAAIKSKLPYANVKYAQGCKWAEGFPFMQVLPSAYLFTSENLGHRGLNAEYFNNSNLSGNPYFIGVDKVIDFVWWTNEPKPGISNDNFSVRWTGILVPEVTGEYHLGGDGFSEFALYLNNVLVAGRSHIHRPEMTYNTVFLESGRKYKIKMEYRQNKSTYPMARLLWDPPGQDLKNEAIDLAIKSDVIILCMGLSPLLEGEEMEVSVSGFSGGDRTDIKLPQSQSKLIKSIMELGKPTVLVLLNGSALAINWESENIPAILEAWYPGQEGGAAIADVLFGDYNPAGRLPVTFYKSVNQLPPFEDYSMEGRTYKYLRSEPLYHFGFGLSYTSFKYSNMVSRDVIMADEALKVSVDVTNSGRLDGDEVIQLYVSHLNKQNSPIRSLQGFKRVHLKSGESKTVEFNILPEQFGLFHPEHNLVVYPGQVKISVGGSQPCDIKLKEGFVLEKVIEIKGEFLCR